MKLRREFLLALTGGLVATAVMMVPVFAQEPLGVITQVALESKKVTFVTKKGDTLELEIKGTTELVDAKGKKIKLETVAKAVSEAIEDGKKGVLAWVTLDKTVASRIAVSLPKEKKAP